MSLPEFCRTFEVEVAALLKNRGIGQISFSRRTYQIEVIDPTSGLSYWPFIQYDRQGELKDMLCGCDADPDEGCLHLAAALTRIHQSSDEPLHGRFANSLWHFLCELMGEKLGFDTLPKKYGQGAWAIEGCLDIQSSSEEWAQRLTAIIEERFEETEENSIKFSNLSDEELELWKKGRPSASLLYELSFFGDFAKALMLEQDGGSHYSIHFSDEDLPKELQVRFEGLQVTFFLTPELLEAAIPALGSVESPLKAYNNPEELIEEILYDERARRLLIREKANASHISFVADAAQPRYLKDWVYVPGDGFYPLERHPLLKSEVIEASDIPTVLSDHLIELQHFLSEISVDSHPESVQATLAFDEHFDLRIQFWVYKENDLSDPRSALFGSWAYIAGHGFQKLDLPSLDGADIKRPELVIRKSDVAAFVSANRSFFSHQEGFRAHISALETKVIYSVDETGVLRFSHTLSGEEKGQVKDFGRWVYLAGQGFFPKVKTSAGPRALARFAQENLMLEPNEVGGFIAQRVDVLEFVAGFFTNLCPITSSKLSLAVNDDGSLSLTPEYRVAPEYEERDVMIYGSYVYTRGEGFYPLPSELRLPEEYRDPMVIPKRDIDLFFAYDYGKISRWIETEDSRFQVPEFLALDCAFPKKSKTLKQKGRWKLSLSYRSQSGAVSIKEITEAFRTKQRYLPSEAGLIDLTEERFGYLPFLGARSIGTFRNFLLISTLDLIKINTFDPIDLDQDNLLEVLLDTGKLPPVEIDALQSTLRPYQEVGVQWLWQLYHAGLSALLCDDMGLGKTHQSMALLAACARPDRERPTFIVICPTTLIFHWEEKLEAFLPSLKVLTYYGAGRTLDGVEKADILLTTYGIWRNDVKKLKKFHFDVAVMDEVQVAKNRTSLVHTALRDLDAYFRLGLTGTPIENSLKDLKSLFDIVLPSYMPKESLFKETFVRPIQREGAADKKQLLTKFVKPFILRRKKEEVLDDLPEKTEEVLHTELKPEQRSLYEELLKTSGRHLLKELEDESEPVQYLHIFTLLSNLKQICNHPAAYLKTPELYTEYHSGKWELFKELLSEAGDSSQKVVVFSHYLAMLDIIELHLKKSGIPFASIRGSTKERGKEVKRFNTDPNCRVFVASLKTAGLGIDLTAGSVVIHYDRWWNAAREDQATDRVHRIGQTRGVQVFKLVTKESVEERIDELILQKSRLLEEVVTTDDQSLLKSLSRNEIITVLKQVLSS